jgi:hypothetical protein
MEIRVRLVPWIAMVWLLSAVQIDSSGAVSVNVSPRVAREPARIIVRVTIEPNSDNRALEVVAESATFFRSSRQQLDGAHAARTSVFQYRDLPAGDYAVRAVLRDAAGGLEGIAAVTVKIDPRGE